jgi:hypothetical protein
MRSSRRIRLPSEYKAKNRLPVFIDDDSTWISYGALAAIHYDMDYWDEYWYELCWVKYEFKLLITELEIEDE